MKDSDLDNILEWATNNSDEGLIVVGGQAIALWELYFGIGSTFHTKDIDFLGYSSELDTLSKTINCSIHYPDAFDSTPENAVLMDGDSKVVDFLSSVQGLSETDVRNRAVLTNFDRNNYKLKLMHPIDCLESKLSNFFNIPNKNNKSGLLQLKSAVNVVNFFINKLVSDHDEKKAISLVNRVFNISESAEGKRIYFENGVDLAKSIDVVNFKNDNFLEENYPRLLESLSLKREKYKKYLKLRDKNIHSSLINTLKP